MNPLIFIIIILDPRYKLEFLASFFNQMYGDDGVGSSLFTNMKSDIHLSFDDYVSTYASSTASESGSGSSSQTIQITLLVAESDMATYGNNMSLMKARFKKHK